MKEGMGYYNILEENSIIKSLGFQMFQEERPIKRTEEKLRKIEGGKKITRFDNKVTFESIISEYM